MRRALPLLILALAAACGAPDGAPQAAAVPATWVDEVACAECHAGAVDAWTGSHHQLAMQPVAGARGLGDFSGRTAHGARFFRQDSLYLVETTGPDGRPATYQVDWVFGVYPLQQVLVPLPGGRLQAFNVAWDSVRQRWIDLFPDATSPRDPLHWSAPQQNWNYMCAECQRPGMQV